MARFSLHTLGPLELLDDRGRAEDLGNRRRKLILLAVLATADRPLKRELLVDMFWGEEDEARARHSLSDALSHLRRVLGPDSILSRQAEVALTPAAQLAVDANELAAAAARGDHGRVIELYRGPFLDGAYVPNSTRFEDWVTRERLRHARAFTRACAAHCALLERDQRWDECIAVAGRWLDADPSSAEAALHVLRALEASAAPDALLRATELYRLLELRLRAEWNLDPDPRVSAAVARIAEAAKAHVDADAPAALSTPIVELLEPSTDAPPIALRARRRRWPRVIGIAASITVLAIIGFRVRPGSVRAAESGNEVVAIVDTKMEGGDSSVAWLGSGFGQMVAADLERTTRIEVIAPARVRALLTRQGLDEKAAIADERAAEIAKRLGAKWSVQAVLHRKDSIYFVQVRVRDAKADAERGFIISGADVLKLADEASARIVGVVDASAPGPHFAEIETANIAALEHFVRATQAADEGRYSIYRQEIDAAIASDSGFTSAIAARWRDALESQDSVGLMRLSQAYERAAPRLTRWDAMDQATYLAFHNGENARAERLARDLVATYPRDPRAYERLSNILSYHGLFESSDSVLQRALALDSLAIAAGRGPCAPCAAYPGEISNQLELGHLANGEALARRWLAVQPELPAAWGYLSTILAAAGRFDDAIHAAQRAIQLSGGESVYSISLARTLVMARRFDAVDSMVRQWKASSANPPEYRLAALDLESIVERERGENTAAELTLRRARDAYHDGGLTLVHANVLARIGRVAAARAEYESLPHEIPGQARTPLRALAGNRARAFAWHHALLADALAETADTAWLRVIADSIEQIGAQSYYARDWRLHLHVRGLLDLRAGRPKVAAQELEQAMFGVAGWTRTNVELARARSMIGDYSGALNVLRTAYQAPPDAMGRYVTRTEIDYWMARTFLAANMRDSAAVYAGYVARAWKNADPDVARSRDSLVALLR